MARVPPARRPLPRFARGPQWLGRTLELRARDPSAAAGPTQKPNRRLVLLLPAAHRLTPPLVLVEVGVGRLVDGLPVLARPPRRYPDADLDVPRRLHAQPCLVDRPAQSSRHVASAFEVCLRHSHRKLISPDSGAPLTRPDPALELLRDEP